jgi:hypothetical protein
MRSCASLPFPKRTMAANGIRTARFVGRTPGSIRGIGRECVNDTFISSTSWSSPTVRDTGVIFQSGGIAGMKSRE